MTKQLSTTIDRSAFTEKNVDELYELGCMTTEQMWQLREACDIWLKALKKYASKSNSKSFGEQNFTQISPSIVMPTERLIGLVKVVESIKSYLEILKYKKVDRRAYVQIKHIEQKLADIADKYKQM